MDACVGSRRPTWWGARAAEERFDVPGRPFVSTFVVMVLGQDESRRPPGPHRRRRVGMVDRVGH
jgi:hypothetical protein